MYQTRVVNGVNNFLFHNLIWDIFDVLTFWSLAVTLRGGADKSLARPTRRCKTESIVSLERGVCSYDELHAFSCYTGWKEACKATRTISTTWRCELSSSFFFLQGKAPKEFHAILKETFREHAPSYATVKNWLAQFKRGDFFTCDAPRPGRPKTVTTPDIIDLIHELFLEDRRTSAKWIAARQGISRERVGSTTYEDLDLRKLSTKWVPKCLNADQKRQRCQSSEQLLELFRRDPNDFLSRLVTMDETWLCHHDPETKQQSMEWQHSGSPQPQKIRSAKILCTSSRLDFLGSRRYPPHWLCCKGLNYQRKVLLISAGEIEGNYEGKTPREGHQGGLVLARQCAGSPGTCNPEETGLPGLPVSWSPTLFSKSGPVGLPPDPWTEKTIERSPFFVRRGGHCCRVDLVRRTTFWIFFLSGLQKLEQWAEKCIELRG